MSADPPRGAVSHLAALTVVIPTFNRPGHLKRLLTYYERVNLQTQFLILDSSDAATAAANAALASSLGARFRHVIFPSSLPVATKLFQGLGLVETPYSAFCADDDLVFPGALAHALDFLSTHADYVCCDGIYLNFFPTNGEIQIKVEYGSRGIEAQNPAARVFRLYQRYESMFYAVFRTPDLRDIFSYVHTIPSLHYQELFQAAGALLKGKSHRLPEFYAARQHCDAAEPTRSNWQTFYWFVDDSAEFLAHYNAYRSELWRLYESCSAEPRMDSKAFGVAMDVAHAVFFSYNCPPAYFHSRMQDQWPADPYVDIKNIHGVLEDLKDESRQALGAGLAQIACALRFLTRGFAKISDLMTEQEIKRVRPIAVRRLNRETAALLPGNTWKCDLPGDLAWLASAPDFRKAFLELCQYMAPL